MAASALTIVSPDNSTTRFNTPCVLGCCGPILTVIVSLRSSGISMAHGLWLRADKPVFNDLAHHVDQRPVDLLHPRRALVGHVHVNVGRTADAPAVAPGQRD